MGQGISLKSERNNPWFKPWFNILLHTQSIVYATVKGRCLEYLGYTVKLGFKELLNKEQIGNSEPFPVTNLPVYLINSEQIGISEQFCDDQKVP